MARGDSKTQTGETQASTNSSTFGGNAAGLYSSLVPQLAAQAAHPAGYSPEDLAAMNTEAEQSAGGAQAGAVGMGALRAARTRNAGAGAAAISDAARETSAGLGKNLLGIRMGDAAAKEHERQSALSGEEGLTGLETGASNSALGELAANSNANTNAANQSWDWARYLLDPAITAAGAAKYPGT